MAKRKLSTSKQQKTVLTLLHDSLKEIDIEKLSHESLYYVDEDTGDMTKIGEYFGGVSLEMVENIKRRINRKVVYSMIFQKPLEELTKKYTSNEIMILLYLISKMGYENALFGITYRGMAKKLGIGLSTISKTMLKFKEDNVLKVYGSKQKKVYYVNPAIAWKGSRVNIRKKSGMFLSKNVSDSAKAE
jgi:hypothetical protein